MDNAMKHMHMALFSVLPEDPNLEEKTQVKVVREEDAIIFTTLMEDLGRMLFNGKDYMVDLGLYLALNLVNMDAVDKLVPMVKE